VRTLALQGGGTRGKWQAVALQGLEARTGKPVWQSFDLIGGTSVGAFNGGLAAVGLPASSVNDFFDQYAPAIFSMHWWQFSVSRLFNSAKYSPFPLEHALQELLGDKTLADCKTRFVATAVDMASGRNVYFQSYGISSEDSTEIIIAPDSGIKMWQVLRASSAAQSYFPGYVWRDKVFWDGGSTGCNAPDMLVFTEAYEQAMLGEIKMLSLGAGRTAWPFKGADMVNPGIKTVLQATLEIAYACGETNEVWQAKTLLGKNHTRWNPDLPKDFAIDDASPATLAALALAAKSQFPDF